MIPTLNSEQTLNPCLASIANQDYPNIEIVVTDGGSKDSTLTLAAKYTSKVLSIKGPLGKARRAGVEKSDGEILGIFDSDIILPHRHWLGEVISSFDRDPMLGIVWFINKAPDGASCVTRCYFNLWNAFLRHRLRSNKPILPGGNSFVLRRAYDQAGGFNPKLHYGEDFDLMHRIIRIGYKVAIAEHPIYHNTMRSLEEFTRKQIVGALTIIKGSQNATDLDLMRTCMTWQAHEKHHSIFNVMKEALVDHMLIGFRGMVEGLAKDKSWLVFPALVSIRTVTYASALTLLYFQRSRHPLRAT